MDLIVVVRQQCSEMFNHWLTKAGEAEQKQPQKETEGDFCNLNNLRLFCVYFHNLFVLQTICQQVKFT